MTALMEAPKGLDDIAEWLGIEVLPGATGDDLPTTRLRQLGERSWSQRPGSHQELKLYRAVVALAKTMPVEGRDLVLDVVRLRNAFGAADRDAMTPDSVTDEIRRLRAAITHLTEERDTARAAVGSTNEDLIEAVERIRAIRSQGNHPRGSAAYDRRAGELNALDIVLRLLRGEEIGRGARV